MSTDYCAVDPGFVLWAPNPFLNLINYSMRKILSSLTLAIIISHSLFSQTILEAIDAKDYERTEQFIKEGIRINKTDKKGQFPLWRAMWAGDAKIVELLIANGADVKQQLKTREGGVSCMVIAVQEGYADIVKLLVEHGADVNGKEVVGHSPLIIASRNGRTEIAQYLIDNGAVIDYHGGNDQATALEMAASKGHLDIVQMLVDKGADVNHQDKDRDTPIGEAAKAGHMEVVQYLLSKKADPSLKNKDGYNAYDRAYLSGQAKIAALLKKEEM